MKTKKSKVFKKKKKLILIGAVILITIIAICLLVLFLWRMTATFMFLENFSVENESHLIDERFATPENIVISPSELYTLNVKMTIENEVHYNHFYIIENDTNIILFECPSKYRTRDRLYFAWTENDGVWVYSGDIGGNYWGFNGGEWIQETDQKVIYDNRPEVITAAVNNHE